MTSLLFRMVSCAGLLTLVCWNLNTPERSHCWFLLGVLGLAWLSDDRWYLVFKKFSMLSKCASIVLSIPFLISFSHDFPISCRLAFRNRPRGVSSSVSELAMSQFAVALVLCITLLALSVQCADTEGSFTVLSYNVAGLPGEDFSDFRRAPTDN